MEKKDDEGIEGDYDVEIWNLISDNEDKKKALVKKKILEGMCICAERINFYVGQNFSGIEIDKEFPTFKADLGDKMIFRQIIEDNFEVLYYDNQVRAFNPKHLGFGLMLQYFYPNYESWIRQNGDNL